MLNVTQATNPSILHLLLSRMLDWPFLLFILALIILGLIIVKGRGRKILDLIGSRKIDVQLAGNKLSIGDAIEAIDDETKQSLDDFRKSHEQIQTINLRLDALEAYLRYVPLKSTRSPD